MAVTTGTINVNSGTTPWTRAHVMDALEDLFGSSHLNWNSGTQQNGVPVYCLYPGQDSTAAATYGSWVNNGGGEDRISQGNQNWERCGGGPIDITKGGADGGQDVSAKDGYSATRYLYVTNNSTNNYIVQDELIPASNGVSGNIITLTHRMGANLTTETKLTYNGQGTGQLSGINPGQVVYMRRVSNQTISLHNSQAGASSNNDFFTGITSTALTDAKRFRTDGSSNPTITAKVGERLYWYSHAVTQGQFRLCDVTTTSGAYDEERVLSDSSKFLGNRVSSSYYVSGQGTYADPYYWRTEYYPQTETETYNPQKVSGTGHTGLHSYGYCNTTQSALKGSVVLLPDYNYEMRNSAAGSGANRPYWKVTISKSGRTPLKLRVYRECDNWQYRGEVTAVTIHNVATGWITGDTFTIPGEDIGGEATTHDIDFGPNAYSSGNNNTPSIVVTNHGAVDNMFQKHPSGDFSVLRMENDANKTFGTTYWAFAIDDTNYDMYIRSGCSWQTLNSLGTNCNSTTSYDQMYGVFGGDIGLDTQQSYSYIDRTPSSTYQYYNTHLQIAATNSPTQYPLKIKYYQSNNTQDDNFAVIQFLQHIGGVDEPYACFTLHRGSTFGSSVWDLNDVWNGTYTEYKTSYQQQNNNASQRGRYIDMKYMTPSFSYSNSTRVHTELQSYSHSALKREASYGYLRNGDSGDHWCYTDTRYSPNIMTSHAGTSYTSEVYTYYRDQTLDKSTQSTNYGSIVGDKVHTVSSNAAYYKPIKGIPINNRFAPCPYYIPDDFVFIQAEVTPPATIFRPGDTITVSAGEVYTIINCDNQINQDGLDGGTDNVAVGMIFAARTTP